MSLRSKTAVFFMGAALVGAAFSARAGTARTMVRESDPVILRGADAGAVQGARISGLRVYAFRDGSFGPVPFQVDEKTKGGDFVFQQGEEADPKDGDGLWNGNDELVLMARDLGDRADAYPDLKGWDKGTLLTARDPVDGGVGFVYVLFFPGEAPPLSPVDYVDIDPVSGRIEALHYRLGFAAEAPMAMDELVVTEAGGGDGIDYTDRLKARLHCSVAGIDIDKNEEDFLVRLVAWNDGPVRVVRRTRSRLILFMGIPSPAARLDNIFYYNSFSFPTEVYLPVEVGFIVKEAHFRVSVDSPRLAGERRYRNNLYPEGVIQDGRMSAAEKEMASDRRPISWTSTGTVGPDGKDHGAWFNRLVVEGDNPDWKPRVFYIDDENHQDAPDKEPGSFGNGGYQIDDLKDITAGVYHVESIMYSVPVWDPSMAELYMRVLDHPLEINLKEL